MEIEVWSDVICPWCYIGKRNLEAALGAFPHSGQVGVTWRSFELDPAAPARVERSMDEILERKYGMSRAEAARANRQMTELAATVGLAYHLDRVQPGNTFDAHRLIHLAARSGLGGAAKERLLAAYFTEGRSVSDRTTLVELATAVGLDSDRAADALDSGEFADDVRADEARAIELGCTGVPFFLVDGRLGIPGAQPPDTLLRLVERAWETSGDAVAGTG